jgi:DNA-binding protein HU-beta
VRGFGSFVTKKRAAKLGRLISLNKTITIPEHYIPAFRPAQNFIDQVKNNYKPRAETTTDRELEAKP